MEENLSNFSVALISLVSNISSFFMANRLISYRITKVEELLKERSGSIEKLYVLEKEQAVIHEQIHELDNRIKELKVIKIEK